MVYLYIHQGFLPYKHAASGDKVRNLSKGAEDNCARFFSIMQNDTLSNSLHKYFHLSDCTHRTIPHKVTEDNQSSS